jgi:nucleotide-binding universal stress UspA family protein
MGRVKTSYPRILRLLVPLDFSGKSRQALRYAVPIAQKFSAKIVLLHVIQPVQYGNARADLLVADRIRRKNDALTRLEDMAAKLVPKGRRGENLVRFGRPSDAILDTIDKLNVDIVVMTTHGRTGLDRLFLGSTAEQVMRRAGCPVLSVRRH